MPLIHPHDILILKETLWPDVVFYDKQIEIIDSTFLNKETHVVAGNQLGKDFIGGFIALTGFLICQVRGITCRIVTTSVAEHHLKVLWGEIGRFWTTCKVPLDRRKGGPLVINYQEIRRAEERDAKNPTNYLVGRVSAKGEGLAGHHAQFTLLIGDEASGLSKQAYEMAQGWAKHMLFIGNPNPGSEFFEQSVEAGDLLAV